MCHSIVQKETKLFELLFDLNLIRIRTIEFSSRREERGVGILLERWLKGLLTFGNKFKTRLFYMY